MKDEEKAEEDLLRIDEKTKTKLNERTNAKL